MDSQTSKQNYEFGRWLSSPKPGDEVVISGISGRFPDSRNIKEFCDNLLKKHDMISDDERRWKLIHPEIPKRIGKLYDIEKFDTGFFGLHCRQAHIMDPMMRIMMEVVIESILDAGINPFELKGTNTGVFVSASWSDMESDTLCNTTEPQKFPVTGYLRSLLAQRISYFLKLKSSSFIIDTACSSSMNAVDSAFRAIRTGQCENAIVAGLNLLLHPGNSLQFFRMGVLSYEGVCRVFDQNAKGYVRGETISTLFLQKAKDSKRIYAQIINTKSNCDGYKNQGITFPSTQLQSQLMQEIYQESGIHPDDLSFLEAHGTGTQVGDPQEVEAIDSALGKKRTIPLYIGSIKSYVGHTEPASGICSIAKIIFAMETGLIPPNTNLKEIKKGIKGFEEGRLVPITDFTKLQKEDAIIGINNFGFGGSNVHIILKRFAKKKNNKSVPRDDIPRLICVSGRTEEAVLTILEDIKPNFDSEFVSLLHEIFKINFDNHLYRGYRIVSKNAILKTSVRAYNLEKSPLYVFFGSFVKNYKVFGSYFMQFPIFQETVDRINRITKLKKLEDMLKDSAKSQEDILGSILVQIALIDVLKSIKLFAKPVFTESLEKVIASYYSGVTNLEKTIQQALTLSKTNFDTNTQNINVPAIFKKISQNTLILNISDLDVNNQFLTLVDNNEVKFLDILGRLFENGHNLHLQNLYPRLEYPVSRNTPMISPLVKWKHDRDWKTYKFKGFVSTDAEQREYRLSYMEEESRYIQGHVVDGRNFIPATEYLHLVWQTFAQSKRRLIDDLSVVFTNCKFIRATTMPKSSFVKILVSIQRGTGCFEVLEKDSVVVSGFIHENKLTEVQNIIEPINFDPKSSKEVLEEDEIYRELYLRGYNYSGVFKGIKKCNTEASAGLIKWEDNWTSFMDKMLQMKILQYDSRLLFIPVGIKKLIINPVKHIQVIDSIKGEEKLVPVSSYKSCNTVISGGVEISGLLAKSISKKKSRLEPVLEKYQFISNSFSINSVEATRIDTQIILENSLATNFKAVELIDDFTRPTSEFLLPLVSKALDDVPVVIPDLTISTKSSSEEIPGIKFDNAPLTSESNLILIIVSNLSKRAYNLNKLLSYLKPSGFILAREKTDATVTNLEEVDIVTEYVTEKEKLVLLKKKEQKAVKYLEVTSKNFDWIYELQSLLNSDGNVIVYCQDDSEGLLGFVNCIRRELHGDKVKSFIIMDEAPNFDPNNPLYSKQIEKNLAVNVYKNKSWGTYRHFLLEEAKELSTCSYFADVTNIGDISSLKWLQNNIDQNYPLTDDQLLVSVYYSGINFKDVMIVSGRVNIESFVQHRFEEETLLGMEFAGKSQEGRRVFGMVAQRGFASYILADKNFLWDIPNSWSMSDAATVPVVYSTVLFALQQIARMKPGCSILIHSAAGGIGIAALNVCTYYKCNIFVTVGTKEKREFLQKHYPHIPESHIGNSRDLSFEDMIKIQTNSRGVDIVLNSLSEDKLKASVRCLARGGYFLEIGKYDLANDTSLELLFLEKKASYHGIMLDLLFKNSHTLKTKIVQLVQAGLEAGFVKPLPQIVFEKEKIVDAFKHMIPGKHIGKVMVKIREEEKEKLCVPNDTSFTVFPRFNANLKSSYIILGGLGGIGLELAEWLIFRGARKLVLVSRVGIQTGYQMQKIELWRSHKVQVVISTQSAATRTGCTEIIKEAQKLGNIDGIFNLAVVLKDAAFENQTKDSFLESFLPKAHATINLDEVTRELCPDLRYFVIFSSVSCGRGNAGQTNYGMANSVMEKICEKRKRDGLPALGIQWGAIGDVGLVAKMQKENKELVIGGTLQQKISSCLTVLDRFLTQDFPIVSSMLVAEKHQKNKLDSAVNAIAYILGVKDIKTVNENTTLAELGLDSIMGTEIIQLLEKEFDIFVTAKDIRGLTFKKIAELENDKKGELNEESKTQKISNFIIQYVPDSKSCSEPMVKLNSNLENRDKLPTIFLLPGLEGSFTPFDMLATKIKGNLVGVQYNFQNCESSVEETASNVLAKIEPFVSKSKKFYIIGYSFGAVIGMQVASYLEQKGYEGKLFLIDGSPKYIKILAKANFPEENENELQTAYLFKLMSLFIPVSFFSPHKDKFLSCADVNERIDLGISLLPDEVAAKQKLEKEAGIALYKRFKAILNYDSSGLKVKSDVHLVQAKTSICKDRDYGVTPLCEKAVSITEIDSDHFTVLNQVEVANVVNKFFSL